QRTTPMPDGSYTIPERVQVSYLLRCYACGLAAGQDRFHGFYLQEFLEYGIHLWGYLRAEQTPKPALIALATLVRQAGSARVVGYVEENQHYCVVFERTPGDYVGLAWSLEDTLIQFGWGVPLPDFQPG